MKKERISILHPQGLGDAIICNGLCRYYANQHAVDKVYVYIPKIYTNLVKWMYRDNPAITVIPINASRVGAYDYCTKVAANLHSRVIFAGSTAINNYNKIFKKYKKFDEVIYEIAKVPYENRYKSFYIQRDLEEEKKVLEKLGAYGAYAFIHDDPDKGFVLEPKTTLKQIRNDKSINLFHLCSALENAEEIHLMESSIKNLCEHLNLKSDKLFRYDEVRKKCGYIGYKISKERLPWKTML
jgi:hypothetical protein